MTQRDWEKTYGSLALVALFLAVCCFVAIMGLIPYQSPQYLLPAHQRPLHSQPSSDIQLLVWLMLGFVTAGLALARRWRRRRNIRISAETYADAFGRRV
jgi:hypothetical protein